jgi:ATP-dependent 26S proteasome regulatory subunit
MSSITYEELLREAMVDLSEMQQQDGKSIEQKIGVNKMNDYKFFLDHWSAMYVKYVQIARKLEKCHDQVLQPQKRGDIRIMLDSCIGRMLELKHKIIEYCGEYVSLDEHLIDLKLTPDALEIPIPKYFVEERAKEIEKQREFIEALRATYQVEGDPTLPSGAQAAAKEPVEPPMTLERAIEILQCNERGRQGRQNVRLFKAIHEQENFSRATFEAEGGNERQVLSEDDGARMIQKVMRGFLSRKKAKLLWQQEYEFLGMEASEKTKSNAERDGLRKTLHNRKMRQANNFAELERETKEMRTRIKVQEGGKMMEEMLDEVLNYLAQVRLATGEQLPAMPTEEEGGSLALLSQNAVQKAEEEAKKKAEEEAAAAKKAPAKDPKKAAKDEEVEALPKLQPSVFWNKFESTKDRYVSTWHPIFNKSYFDNKDFDQQFDKAILRHEILDGPGGTMAELRKCVDQLVMVELTNLKERMERERGGRRKPPKKPKAPKKPKNQKDPSEGKKMELHSNSLVRLSVLELPPKVALSDYIGSPDMMGSIMDAYETAHAEQQDEVKAKWQALLNNWNDYVEKSLNMTKEQFEILFANYNAQFDWRFEPSMQQVRQAVTEYCILPLGSQIIHDFAPHPTGVLLYGHAKSGKTMLTHAICNEAGANLFNLSPHVLNREGVNLQKLVQVVFRVARALAPSVIYLDEVEKVFPGKGKKKPKKGETGGGKSAKIKKDLVNQIKELDPSDRVLVVGNTRTPWDADFKELTANFRAMICCVHPDYASRYQIWQKLLAKKGASFAKMGDYQTLAYMTNKYTSGTIAKVIDDTLTDRRVRRLTQRPLKADEFLPALARAIPIYREDYAAMKEWVQKLPLTMRRAMRADFKEEEETDPKKKKPAPKKK